MKTEDERRLRRLQREIDALNARLAGKYAERDGEIVKIRDGGATLEAIGEVVGVSRVRIQQLIESRKGPLQVAHPEGKVTVTSEG